MGEKSWIDVEIEVNSNLNVERADEISKEVRQAIEAVVDHLGEVTVYCKPLAEKTKSFSIKEWFPFGRSDEETKTEPEKA